MQHLMASVLKVTWYLAACFQMGLCDQFALWELFVVKRMLLGLFFVFVFGFFFHLFGSTGTCRMQV